MNAYEPILDDPAPEPTDAEAEAQSLFDSVPPEVDTVVLVWLGGTEFTALGRCSLCNEWGEVYGPDILCFRCSPKGKLK